MQALLAPPRQNLTVQNVMDAISGAGVVSYDCGIELLDLNLAVLGDVSAALVRQSDTAQPPTVTRDCAATVQESLTCTLEPARALVDRQDGAGLRPWVPAWGTDRVRVYMSIRTPSTTSQTVSTYANTYSDTYLDVYGGPTTGSTVITSTPVWVRFNVGVFILTTAPAALDDATGNASYDVTGYGLNTLLQAELGKSDFVAKGTNVLAAVSARIGNGLKGRRPLTSPTVLLNLDSTKAASVASADRAWTLSPDLSPTYIGVVQDLLSSVSYGQLWTNQDGYFTAGPNIAAAKRPVEFTFTGAGAFDTILAPGRTRTGETYLQPNQWIFRQNGLDYLPVEGGGQCTVTDVVSPTGYKAVGFIRPTVQYVDASSQDDLQAQALAYAKSQVADTEIFTFTSAPVPIAGQFDVVGYYDPAIPADATGVSGYRKLEVQSWILVLDGSADMQWTANATPDPAALVIGSGYS